MKNREKRKTGQGRSSLAILYLSNLIHNPFIRYKYTHKNLSITVRFFIHENTLYKPKSYWEKYVQLWIKYTAIKLKINDRVNKLHKQQAFITAKDHKDNFATTCISDYLAIPRLI